MVPVLFDEPDINGDLLTKRALLTMRQKEMDSCPACHLKRGNDASNAS